MNLHDWMDELCDALDLDAEVDETLLLDLARDVAHAVARPAAPLSAFLVGLAAGARGGGPAVVEELAERARSLAERWDKPPAAGDDALTEVEDLDPTLVADLAGDEEE